jgi:predicted N-acetyltransferase YhbS
MVEIRPETPDDFECVFQVHEATFGSSEEAKLVDTPRATVDPCISLVAVVEGQDVGHIFVSPVALEPGFRYESEEFDRAFQVPEVVAGSLEGCSGYVRYPKAFGSV